MTLWAASGRSGPRCWVGLGRRLLLLPPAALAAHLGRAAALRAPVLGLPVWPAAALLPAQAPYVAQHIIGPEHHNMARF